MSSEKKGLTMREAVLAALVVILLIVAAVAWTTRAPAPPAPALTVTQTVAQTVIRTVTPALPAGISQLKVVIILPISEEDYSWNYAAFEAATRLQKVYGFELAVERNLFDGTVAEPYAVDYAKRGFNIVILQGIQYMDMAQKIAPGYPKTLFVCVDCFKVGAPNVYNIWMTIEEGGFILGAIAGKLTKTNMLGLVGGGRVPSIWAGHEAFKAGVLYTNPKATFKEAYMAFSWADVAGAKKTAESYIAAGADVVFSSGDGVDVGVVEAAKEKKVWGSSVYADLPKLKPELKDILMGSIVFDWEVVYSAAIRDYLYGTWEYGFLTATMASGIIKVSVGPNVPEPIKKLAMDLQTMIMFGTIKISFEVDPRTGSYVCFDRPELPQCVPTGAKVSYLPPTS